MSETMTMAAQIAAMAEDWSQFRAKSNADGLVTWTGPLEAEHQTFVVEATYAIGMEFPWVRVRRPRLVQRPDFADGPLPHVYWRGDEPGLCLFDPLQKEWNASMAISRTTIPWTIDWLYFYEIWSMTGKWLGGGRHRGQPIPVKPQQNDEVTS